MPQRPPRGPRDPEFQRLQAIWDRKLKRSGFRDIEAGADLNKFRASSFEDDKVEAPDDPKQSKPTHRKSRSCNCSKCKRPLVSRYIQIEDADREEPVLTLETAQLEAESLYGAASVAATPIAQAWSVFSAGAHRLPDGPTKRLLLDLADAGCITADIKKRHKKSRQNIRTIFESHCRAMKLPTNTLLVPGRTKRRA